MKIALVRARYNPYGGAERFAARAMRALADDRAHATDVAVLARSWCDVEAGEAVRLVRCDPFYLGSVWRDASFATAVRRALAREPFDLVQSHERIVGLPIYRAGDGVHASWLERRARAAGPSTRLGIALNPHHRYLLRVERRMFEDAALRVVICNSTMVRDEIADRFAIDRAKLVTIPNGVDLDRFHPSARGVHRDAMRTRLAIDTGATVFTMVGSGFERKGVSDALRALRGCPHGALVVVGDDKHRRRYEAQASTHGVAARVRFVGPVADTLPYHAMADCLLAPRAVRPVPERGARGARLRRAGHRQRRVRRRGTDRRRCRRLGRRSGAGRCVAGGDERDRRSRWRRGRGGGDAASGRSAAEPHSLAALSASLLALYRSLLATPATSASTAASTKSPVINSPAA